MKRLAPIFALAILCASCGQLASARAQKPQGLDAGQLAGTTTPRTQGANDYPSSSGPSTIKGNSSPGNGAVGRGAQGPAATPRATSSPSAGSTRGAVAGRPLTTNRQIQAQIRADARHNRPLLPPGFPFVICPVEGPYSYSDDFGAPRCTSGARSCGGFHLHMGNDLLSSYGTPIVAPFDGRAVNATNLVGGNSVIVYGAEGFVFNAHLVAFGRLGQVRAGDVIGFVGNTGDAAGGPTHDHFEWHPNGLPSGLWRSAYGQTEINGAIDPYPYLRVVCPPA